jgi:sugar O-acyltransferase (sialic acid O-acetyltransferase NeuD family)
MNTSPSSLILLGAGGHAAVVTESARRAGHSVAAIASAERVAADAVFGTDLGADLGIGSNPGSNPGSNTGSNTIAWLGDPDDAAGEAAIRARAALGARLVLAVGDPKLRLRWSQRFAGLFAAAVVDPDASVSPSAVLEEGVFIGAGAVVQARARVGAHAIVNTRAVVEHDCVLGAASHVAPGAILCGNVVVGEGAQIGAGAVVIPGRSIGAGAQVGAGAVVVRDVPAMVTVRGVPARA